VFQVATGSIESAVHTLTSKLDVLMLSVMAKANKEQRWVTLRKQIICSVFVFQCLVITTTMYSYDRVAGASNWRKKAQQLKRNKATRCWTPCIPML
jgi:heme/copper-type cytochrome/quinol oxidase subunit 2